MKNLCLFSLGAVIVFGLSSCCCVRTFSARSGSCGSTSTNVVKASTAQGAVGSPHIGLVPTMKTIAP